MFCLKCGQQIEDTAMTCPYCGCPTENSSDKIDTGVIDPSVKSAEGLGLAAIVIGAIGILMAWLIALLGYIFGGAGLALALVAKNKNPNCSKAKTGMILSIITLACAVINSILGILIML